MPFEVDGDDDDAVDGELDEGGRVQGERERFLFLVNRVSIIYIYIYIYTCIFTYIVSMGIFVLVYQLGQDVGDDVEDGGLNESDG